MTKLCHINQNSLVIFTARAMLSAVFLQAGRRPSGIRDSMQLGDFIDFISVERVKEKTTM